MRLSTDILVDRPILLFVIVDQTAEAANVTGSFRVAIVAGCRLFERTGDDGNGCTGVCSFKECDEELSKSRGQTDEVLLLGSVLRGPILMARSLALSDQAQEGHLVDALALRGDEGRSTLR